MSCAVDFQFVGFMYSPQRLNIHKRSMQPNKLIDYRVIHSIPFLLLLLLYFFLFFENTLIEQPHHPSNRLATSLLQLHNLTWERETHAHSC